MAEQVRLTKTELRDQQTKLVGLNRYLPTLQLKKAMLQVEVSRVDDELEALFAKFTLLEERVARFSALLMDPTADALLSSAQVLQVQQRMESVAGVDTPYFESVLFAQPDYFLFDTPVWLENAIYRMQELISVREQIRTTQTRRTLLAEELKDVSIRVNLFEKILIPRAMGHINRIKIFLGDQEMVAVARAKVSKRNIQRRT